MPAVVATDADAAVTEAILLVRQLLRRDGAAAAAACERAQRGASAEPAAAEVARLSARCRLSARAR